MALVELISSRCFNGYQKVFQHTSKILNCNMKFGVYLPEQLLTEKLPILFFLSGLHSNQMNFIEKTGFQRFASEHRVVVVNPDTSPQDKIYDKTGEPFNVGNAASYYLDATQPKWVELNFKMYTYLIKEFIPLIFDNFSVDPLKCGISGHSMGGHGALIIGLKNPTMFRSISTLAAICNPINSDICCLAFKSYLGEDKSKWSNWDSVELAKIYDGPKRRILIDQGSDDCFYKINDLLPQNLINVNNSKIQWDFRLRENYDHGYLYISTFIHEHFEYFMEQISSENKL